MLTDAIDKTGHSETYYTFTGMENDFFSQKEAHEAFQLFLKREFNDVLGATSLKANVNVQKIALGLCLIF